MATVECTWSGRSDGGSARRSAAWPVVRDRRPTAVSPCCCCSDCWRTWRWSARTSPSVWCRSALGSPARPRRAGRTLWSRRPSTGLSRGAEVIGGTHKIASGYCCRRATRTFAETAPRTLPDLSDLRFLVCHFSFLFLSRLISNVARGRTAKMTGQNQSGGPSIVPRSLPARSYGDVLLYCTRLRLLTMRYHY